MYISTSTKSVLVLALLAALFAGCSKEQTDKAKQDVTTAAEKTKDALSTAADKTADAAVKAKDAIKDKMTEWKLTPDDIRDDLQKTGRVVRAKTANLGQRAGEFADDTRIVAAIKAKYLTDADLSVIAISVSSEKGLVTLNGSVKSIDLAGRAMAIALDTQGVDRVFSLLRVAP